jgi:SLT domain-containing protein
LLLEAAGLLFGFGGGLSFGASNGVADPLRSIAGSARASGGPVSANQSYLVGEEGPEVFTPPNSGNILSVAQAATVANGGGAGQTVVQSPPVNVSVINVIDQEEALAALDTPSGEQKILNIISRNPNVIKQSIG